MNDRAKTESVIGMGQNMQEDNIPVSARIMALADVFDALISRRVYKSPMSFDDARDIIAGGLGKHFDPAVVDSFLAGFEDFVGIATRYSAAA